MSELADNFYYNGTEYAAKIVDSTFNRQTVNIVFETRRQGGSGYLDGSTATLLVEGKAYKTVSYYNNATDKPSKKQDVSWPKARWEKHDMILAADQHGVNAGDKISLKISDESAGKSLKITFRAPMQTGSKNEWGEDRWIPPETFYIPPGQELTPEFKSRFDKWRGPNTEMKADGTWVNPMNPNRTSEPEYTETDLVPTDSQPEPDPDDDGSAVEPDQASGGDLPLAALAVGGVALAWWWFG